MVDVVKGSFDVSVDNPLSCIYWVGKSKDSCNGIMTASSWPEAIAAVSNLVSH